MAHDDDAIRIAAEAHGLGAGKADGASDVVRAVRS